jgi:hypothetical protein
MSDISTLERSAYRVRRFALRMGEVQGQGYIGQALGWADVLAVAYRHAMTYRAGEPEWEGRDRFLLSHGHYAIAHYAALIEAGIIPEIEQRIAHQRKHCDLAVDVEVVIGGRADIVQEVLVELDVIELGALVAKLKLSADHPEIVAPDQIGIDAALEFQIGDVAGWNVGKQRSGKQELGFEVPIFGEHDAPLETDIAGPVTSNRWCSDRRSGSSR